MPDRFVRCVVPFCEGGYRAREGDSSNEAICQDHWRLVDTRLKASRTRRLKELDGDDAAPVAAYSYWARMRCQAIERAAGIA